MSPNENNPQFFLTIAVLLLLLGVASFFVPRRGVENTVAIPAIPEELVLPATGVELPVKWGDLGRKLIEAGIIDEQKFKSLYAARPELLEEVGNLLSGKTNGNLRLTKDNANFVLNLLWAFGLANKNPILEQGPMATAGDTENFASTGGWTLAKGSAMEHYSKHSFVKLNLQQQELVERTAKNIYRLCCNNPTYFPDCNHGMAMLGLLELLAAQGADEKIIYQTALAANSFWFPNNYLTIAQYFKNKNVDWLAVNSKEALGYDFSSASGFQKIASSVTESKGKKGASCGI